MTVWRNIFFVFAGMTLTLSQSFAQTATGFYRTEKMDDRWWMIDPEGKPFISRGVTSIRFMQDCRNGLLSEMAATNQKVYGNQDAWAHKTVERLFGWGFNTLGPWSDDHLGAIDVDGRKLAATRVLNFIENYAAKVRQDKNSGYAWLVGSFPDIFSPDFEAFSYENAKSACEPYKNSHTILGWFSDNELRWGPDWRTQDELLTTFLALPPAAAGRQVATKLLQSRHGDIASFNTVWKTSYASWEEMQNAPSVPQPIKRKAIYLQNVGDERNANEKDPLRGKFVDDCDAFLALAAERYFSVTSAATRAADPNHLLLGSRFAYVPPRPVIIAAAKYLDVISFNCYDYNGAEPAKAIQAYSVVDKPLLIGEFSYKAKDSGMPNTRGAGRVVATQADRADMFVRYVHEALSWRHVVGYQWFQYADQPKDGRIIDSENSNFGLINGQDAVYEPLVQAMARENANAEALHRQAVK